MLRNYFVIAFRNFLKQKSYTFINVFGLAVGLASAICIFLYVEDELSYNTNHPGYEDIYALAVSIHNREGRIDYFPLVPGGWANRLKQTLPEVESVAKEDWFGYPTTLHHKPTDKIILTEEIRWVSNGFGEVLNIPLINGNPKKALELSNSILLSEEGAKTLFGNQEALNQPITMKHPFLGNGQEIELVVTGVYKNYPSNSHFKPKYIINSLSVKMIFDQQQANGFEQYYNSMSFNSGFFYTYVKLTPGSDTKNLRTELARLTEETFKTDSAFQAQGGKLGFDVVNMKDIHFDSRMSWEANTRGDKTYLAIFSGVAILILVIACINYMNLATARSSKRAKEVGMRKSLGGMRSELAFQFIQESGLVTLLSLVVAMVLVVVLLPAFNTLSNKSFGILDLFNPQIILIISLTVVFVTIVGGSYPAFFLSAFKPAEVLKGKLTKGKGADLFRTSLVTLQFSVAMILVIATVVILKQMNLMQESKLNEKGDQILSIRYGGSAPPEKYQPFKNAVLSDPDIEHVTIGNHLPRLDFFGPTGAVYRFADVSDQEYQWNQLNVDFDFPATYDLEFIAGRNFDPNNTADSSAFLMNEAAVKALNKTPEDVIGLSAEHVQSRRHGNVIGVIKDFPFRSAHYTIEPLVLNPRPHQIDKIVYVQLPAGKIAEKIAFLEKTWKEVIPGVGFDYWFLRDEFNRMYETERRISGMAKSFAVLALAITILGLYGLASYTAEQKTKEVGIRKVMGASSSQIVKMFLKNFIVLFLIASAVAIPLSWYLSDQWLSGFAYRIPLSAMIFVFCIAALMIITLLTVSYETFKASVADPIKAIKYE
ncbi:ABC transporter permease [Chryseolinea sp. H1M3-3]|uniref:ABC transporter permease n=1 Tax=Chryseolinea sp. H1M3-3 TaxID=3034144 RepID=UPI0023ECB1FD|nr:ABC transporter permease [Chryseolinea sp. H1M3-3]